MEKCGGRVRVKMTTWKKRERVKFIGQPSACILDTVFTWRRVYYRPN